MSLSYTILGNEIQALELHLKPAQSVLTEKGSLVCMEKGVTMDVQMGGSTEEQSFLGKMVNAGKRMLGGEKLFMLRFDNTMDEVRKLVLATPSLGSIIPVSLKAECPVLCQRGTFLCSEGSVLVTMGFHKNIAAVFLAGASLVMQRLRGDGLAFLHASGTVITRQLSPGETLLVDPSCLIALEDTVSFELKATGGITNMAFAGEGIVLSSLTGPGTVWLQSLPFWRFQERVLYPLVEALKKNEV